MSRRTKLTMRSRCWIMLAMTSRMTVPPRGERPPPSAGNHQRSCRRRPSLLSEGGRLRRHGLLCLFREAPQHHARRHEREVKVEVGHREERARDHEGVETELGHLGVVGEGAVLRMPAPPLSDAPQAHERADEDEEIETQAQEAMLFEQLEVETVSVSHGQEVASVVLEPDALVPQRSEAGPGERAIDRDVPGGLPGLDASLGRAVSSLLCFLLPDGIDALRETVRKVGEGHQGSDEKARREP